VEDFSQDMTVNVAITHQEVWETKPDEDEDTNPHKFVIGGTKPHAQAPPKSADIVATKDQTPAADAGGGPVAAAPQPEEDDDDDVILVVDDPSENENKRAAVANGDEPPAKKLKASNGNGSNGHEVVIEID
jgi:hypothetical protein